MKFGNIIHSKKIKMYIGIIFVIALLVSVYMYVNSFSFLERQLNSEGYVKYKNDEFSYDIMLPSGFQHVGSNNNSYDEFFKVYKNDEDNASLFVQNRIGEYENKGLEYKTFGDENIIEQNKTYVITEYTVDENKVIKTIRKYSDKGLLYIALSYEEEKSVQYEDVFEKICKQVRKIEMQDCMEMEDVLSYDKGKYLIELARKYSPTTYVEIEEYDPTTGVATLHCFEIVDEGDGTSHTATMEWLYINKDTLKGIDLAEREVDLSLYQ